MRYLIRRILRRPAVAVAAFITLTLGIGGNALMFSAVKGVIMNPLPYVAPERIVVVWESHGLANDTRVGVSYPNFLDLRDRSRTLERLAAYGTSVLTLTTSDRATRVQIASVTGDFFDVIGVTLALGRTFKGLENRSGSERRVVIASHGVWQREFGGDPKLVGAAVRLNGMPFTVVGVMPAAFHFPSEKTDFWFPLEVEAEWFVDRSAHDRRVVGRLAPNATLADARAEGHGIARQIELDVPGLDPGIEFVFSTLDDEILGDVRPALVALMAAAIVVLLIACSNVANLMLASGTTREREFALRAALGASPTRLFGTTLVESLVLALLSGIAGVMVAVVGAKLLFRGLSAEILPRSAEVQVDGQVLAYTLAATIVTAVVFGLLPAFHASRQDVVRSLGRHSPTTAGDRQISFAQNALVVLQVAGSVVLLVSAGLLIRTVWALNRTALGFEASGVLAVRVTVAGSGIRSSDETAAFFRSLQDRLAAMPGVIAVSAINEAYASRTEGVSPLGATDRRGPEHTVDAVVRQVLPGYFRTLRIPLLNGRDFDDRDLHGPSVAIVNERFVNLYWSGRNAIGQRLAFQSEEEEELEPPSTIIGVVGDVRDMGLGGNPQLTVYKFHGRQPQRTMDVMLRASTPPAALAPAVREVVRETRADVPVYDIATLSDRLSRTIAPQRMNRVFLLAFATVGLVIALVGVYAVLSYVVARRSHEYGIRMALGASRTQVLSSVVRRGFTLVATGIVSGAILSVAATQSIRGLLYGVNATDPLTIVVVAVAVGLVALVACALPAVRATQVDPLGALKSE